MMTSKLNIPKIKTTKPIAPSLSFFDVFAIDKLMRSWISSLSMNSQFKISRRSGIEPELQVHYLPVLATRLPTKKRITGFEPATPNLEGWCSTAELYPRSS